MKRIKRSEPKHIEVALNFCQQELGFSFNPRAQPLQPCTQNSPKPKMKLSTNGKRIEQQKSSPSGIIRLGSKKKLLRTESKQNVSLGGSRLQKSNVIDRKQEKSMKNSLDKYFKNKKDTNKLEIKKIEVNSFTQNKKSEQRYKTENNPEQNIFNFERITIKDSVVSTNQKESSVDNKQKRMSYCKSFASLTRKRESSIAKSCSLNKYTPSLKMDKKMEQRIKNIKKYKFIQEYITDLELQGIFNELQLADVPECRWPLIIIDKVYQIMKQRSTNDFTGEVIRKF